MKNTETRTQQMFFEKEDDETNEDEDEEDEEERRRTTISVLKDHFLKLSMFMKFSVFVVLICFIVWISFGFKTTIQIGIDKQEQQKLNEAFSNENLSKNLRFHIFTSVISIVFGFLSILFSLSTTPSAFERIFKLSFATTTTISIVSGLTFINQSTLPFRIGIVATFLLVVLVIAVIFSGVCCEVFLLCGGWKQSQIWFVRCVFFLTGIVFMIPIIINFSSVHKLRDTVVLFSQMLAIIGTSEFFLFLVSS